MTGRFLSRDPLGAAPDVNLYRYVGNNPLTYVDPDGWLSLMPGGVGGVGAGGLGPHVLPVPMPPQPIDIPQFPQPERPMEPTPPPHTPPGPDLLPGAQVPGVGPSEGPTTKSQGSLQGMGQPGAGHQPGILTAGGRTKKGGLGQKIKIIIISAWAALFAEPPPEDPNKKQGKDPYRGGRPTRYWDPGKDPNKPNLPGL